MRFVIVLARHAEHLGAVGNRLPKHPRPEDRFRGVWSVRNIEEAGTEETQELNDNLDARVGMEPKRGIRRALTSACIPFYPGSLLAPATQARCLSSIIFGGQSA
jgi:hypothetical protein